MRLLVCLSTHSLLIFRSAARASVPLYARYKLIGECFTLSTLPLMSAGVMYNRAHNSTPTNNLCGSRACTTRSSLIQGIGTLHHHASSSFGTA
eukprot:6883756-Pyramimonas_sp.AAC.2